MKTIKRLFVIIFPGLIVFAGCSSLKPISYTLVEDEANPASISFASGKRGNPRVSLVFFNDNSLPEPEKGTVWNPILFPSGMPLELTVNAYYYQAPYTAYNVGFIGALISTAVTASIAAARTVDIDVIFSCPPLDAGKSYSLSFRKGAGNPGINRLILIEDSIRRIIYQQEFEMR